MSIADLRVSIAELIYERGPMTVAAFMDLALYHPELGYYARASQRSGRAGDFFTSVDVGPMFGELLARQIAQMADILADAPTAASAPFDLVEAGAGNGRLSADILRALRRDAPAVFTRTRLHLVEASAAARAEQRDVLADLSDRLTGADALPAAFEGVLVANELLDAMPVHQVVMRDSGLREVYVAAERRDGQVVVTTTEGPLSTPEIATYLTRAGAQLEPGWRSEINLAAVAWMRDVARRLRRGYVVLLDYGHDARELYSATHATGTLTTFSGHTSRGPESHPRHPAWLENPGNQDITAHVDFTSIEHAAESEGMETIAFLDQTYFLMGVIGALGSPGSTDPDLVKLGGPENLKDRLALKTLLMPGGLGSTMKVMILGKDVPAAPLAGCSYRVRVT